ncbi:MAG: alkene reductase [Gammaproteobacteria bacterium]|nr:MAG: alkene reductase [Gammaproteobacteria bacterium]
MSSNTEESTSIDLFSPIALGDLKLPNRIIMAPLTRNRAAMPGNVPQPMNATYYAQRAGAGLIITEASQVSPEGIGYPATPGMHSEEQVQGWLAVNDAVHAKGGRIFMQLWYCGRISHPDLLPDSQQPVSASAIRPEGDAVTYEGLKPFVEPRALHTDEMPVIVDQYRQAARCAREAGFDGVEVHSANGYLLDQFLRDGTNQRDDSYGGSLENRTRLLREVLSAVLETWNPARVGVRISPENSFNDIRDSDPPATFRFVSRALSGMGLGYLHVVEGDMMTGERGMDYRQIRDQFDGYYMANCGYDKARGQAAISGGDADMVSFGKLYLANPDLVQRFKTDADLNTPDPDTFYGGDEKGYTDYPTLA